MEPDFKVDVTQYCMDTEKDWDEGLPFVLFAIRETIQESLGSSPAEFVLWHTVRGLLKVLKDHIADFIQKSVGVSEDVCRL